MSKPNPPVTLAADLPQITSSFLNQTPPGPGPSINWFRFFTQIWNRTGGHQGIDGDAIQDAADDFAQLIPLYAPIKGKVPPPLPIVLTPGASPIVYYAPFDGFLIVTGGTITSITLCRDGTNQITITGGVIPVAQGDAVTVTYSVVPTHMTMIGS